jgi:hypothetical protein
MCALFNGADRWHAPVLALAEGQSRCAADSHLSRPRGRPLINLLAG